MTANSALRCGLTISTKPAKLFIAQRFHACHFCVSQLGMETGSPAFPPYNSPAFSRPIIGGMGPSIILTDKPSPGVAPALSHLLLQFNESASGRPNDYRPLVIHISNPDSGETLGGLWGGTYCSFFHVELLYLPESMRGAGLGRRLIAQAEEEALRRGCRGAWLDTFSFQALGFYEKLGYSVFGTIEEFPPGHSRFFLRKTLSVESASL